jgi:hypothetical protein
MELTAEDLQTLTYTLLGEARGEGLAGMYAVANVIRNRADSPAYPDNPVDVALQPWQFSTNNGPNMGGGNQTETRREVRPGSALYRTAEDVARAVFETDEPIDITGNALMYHARGVTPYWASSSTTAYGTRRINNHVFYPRGEMPADPVAEAYVAVNGLRVARFAAETPAEQFGARANVYTPSIEELEAWNDDGNSTPLQRYAFDRLAARDFYGINDRGILSAVRDEVRQSPRQRIAEARAEQLRFAARKTAEAGAIERSYGSPPIERVSSGSLSWPTQSEIIVRELSPQYPTPLSSKGSAWTNFETPLTRQEERQFQAWKAVNAPDDSGYDYDLRGAFKAGLTRGPDGHMLDTFKKPNHPTFSVESQYAPDAPALAGTWDKKGNFVFPAEAVDLWDAVPAGSDVPRETGIRPKPLTAKQRYAIADSMGMGPNMRVTSEGLAVRIVPLVTLDENFQPVITPTPRRVTEPIAAPQAPRSGPVGQTSSRGATGAAQRRVAAAKQEAAAAARMIPIRDPMRADIPEEREGQLTAKPTGQTRGRGEVGAARRSAAQQVNRLPKSSAGMTIEPGADDASVFKYVPKEVALAEAANISSAMVKLRVGEVKKPAVTWSVPPRRPTTPAPTQEMFEGTTFGEQIKRLDAMPGPAAGAPKGDPITPGKLLDGIENETRRLAGMPSKSPPLPKPDPRRASTLKSPAPLPAPKPLTFDKPTVKTTISPKVPARRPDNAPSVQLELTPSVPANGIAIAAGTIPGLGAISNAQKLALAPKPGKVSLQTVKAPTKPTVKMPDSKEVANTGRPTAAAELGDGRVARAPANNLNGRTTDGSAPATRLNQETGNWEPYGQPVSYSGSGVGTFQGSSTGRTYTVGQTYSNATGTYTAQSNGTFKRN